jgi:hypothetical protein
MIAMTKEEWLRMRMKTAEQEWHLYNIKSKRYAISDYRRSTIENKNEIIADIKSDIAASKKWLYDYSNRWRTKVKK